MRLILSEEGVMDTVRNLEKQAAGWYKQLPHLPAEVRSWLGNNVWWLVLIGVVLMTLGLLVLIPLTLAALGLSALIGTASLLGTYNYTYDGGLGIVWLSALVTFIGSLVVVVLTAMAVGPLKAKSKKGWSLLFLTALVNLLFAVAGDILALSVVGIVGSLLWTAVEGYFLFEIRDEFGRKVAAKHAADAPAAKK